MSFDIYRNDERDEDATVSFPIRQTQTAWPVEFRKRAIDEFETETTDPQDSFALDRELAESFCRQKRFADAERIYREISKQDDSFDVRCAIAKMLYLQEKDVESLEAYEHALGQINLESQGLFETYKNIGNLSVKQGDHERAEEFYNKAYTIEPESADLLVNYGTLEVQRGNAEKAGQHFAKAVEIDSQNDKAWVGLALIHHSKSDADLAWGSAQRALDISPSNRTALGLIVQWAFDRNALGAAIERICDYLSYCDQDGEMSLLLVRLFLNTGQFELARIEVERAIQLLEDPSDAFQIKFELDRALRGNHAK